VNDQSGSSRERFDRPIFIISTPRSGSTLLFETLEQAPNLFTTGKESHGRIESVPGLFPGERGWDSNRLTAVDATQERVETLARGFLEDLTDRDRSQPVGRFRMLEKTPKNALRVPFFAEAWSDSMFVYLYRDVRETLASMIEAWMSGRFRTYPRLPGWQGPAWSLLLVPSWRELNGRPLPEIVARQWAITTNCILDDLEELGSKRVRVVAYSELLAKPQRVVTWLADSLGLEWDKSLGNSLALSKTTVSRPDKDKWRQIEGVIETILPIVEAADERARTFLKTASPLHDV
jgi:hypothetical protein